MSESAIKQIQSNYSDFEIVQIGLKTDRKTPFQDALGLEIWETVKLIATSAIFIGVNSGFMNVAKCYPKIRKKVLITNKDLKFYHPCFPEDYWIDYNWEYFNETDKDVGITNSYLKI